MEGGKVWVPDTVRGQYDDTEIRYGRWWFLMTGSRRRGSLALLGAVADQAEQGAIHPAQHHN